MGSFGINTQPGILQDCHHPSITITDKTEGKQRRHEGIQQGTCVNAASV